MKFFKKTWLKVKELYERFRGQRFSTEKIRFCGYFDRTSNILILPPQNPYWFALSLKTAISILKYFTGKEFYWGPEEYAQWFLTYGTEPERVIDFKDFSEEIDIIFDLSPPPSHYLWVPEKVKATYRVSYDLESFPYYNIMVKVDFNGKNPYESLCKALGIPLQHVDPTPSKETKTRVWNFLRYQGHTSNKTLIFLDTQLSSSEIAEIETAIFDVTFVSTKPGNGIDVSRFSPEEKLAALSLSEAYIGEESIFLPIAIEFGIPVILRKRPPQLKDKARIFTIEEIGSLKEAVLMSLPHEGTAETDKET